MNGRRIGVDDSGLRYKPRGIGDLNCRQCPTAGITRKPEKGVKEVLTTDFADCTDKHTVTHPCDP